MKQSLLILFLSLLFITPCYASKTGKGKVKEGLYHSKYGKFTVQVPHLASKPKIVEVWDEPMLTATLKDDVGTLFQIESALLEKSLQQDLHTHNAFEPFLTTFFHHAVLKNIHQTIPHAQVLYREKVIINDDQLALFVLVDIPNSATPTATEAHFDAVRGFLLFFEEQGIVAVSCQKEFTQEELFDNKIDYFYRLYRDDLCLAAQSFQRK